MRGNSQAKPHRPTGMPAKHNGRRYCYGWLVGLNSGRKLIGCISTKLNVRELESCDKMIMMKMNN